MKLKLCMIVTSLLAPVSAQADVIVLGNTETGAVVIRGNFPDGTEAAEAVQEAKSQRTSGWIHSSPMTRRAGVR